MENIKQQSLEKALAELSNKGVSVDSKQLKHDICRQFPDYRLWVREFIVNAFDAGAKNCRITGIEEGEVHIIIIEDDGHGMNKEQLEGFLMKFRSTKNSDAVGRFGIGSFSVAAVPGQCAFFVVTSTGEETWRFSTGSLLESTPIVVERLEEVRPRGTTFDITFKATERTVLEEMNILANLAYKYLYHLPINQFFNVQQKPDMPEPKMQQWIPGNWLLEPNEYLAKRFCFSIGEDTYDVVLALGRKRQALYQKRILITENSIDHNMAEIDPQGAWSNLPYLIVRVDSDSFEMPLGRHCLSDTGDLLLVSRKIQSEILYQFVDTVIAYYGNGECETSAELFVKMEDFLCGYLALAPNNSRSVNQVRMFITYDGTRVSFADLQEAVQDGKNIYFEDKSSSGVDYDLFDGPVLSSKQPADGLGLISSFFGDKVLNLTMEDLVQEAPGKSCKELSKEERGFSDTLTFHPDAFEEFKSRPVGGDESRRSKKQMIKAVKSQLVSRADRAIRDLQRLKWKVSYLVGRDGETPCTSIRYLYRDNSVTLNLHHEEIRNLVKLSETAPLLSSHFAIALCLSSTGKNCILQHLSSKDREDLLNLDAILRCGDVPRSRDEERGKLVEKKEDSANRRADFNRNSTMNDLPF